MNIIDIIDRTIPELIDLSQLLLDTDKNREKINVAKQTLFGDNTEPLKKYTIDENNALLVRSKLLLINKLNRKIFSNLLEMNAIIKSAYETERYALQELLIDIVPSYIAQGVFFEEHQIYSIANAFGLTSQKIMKNKKLNLNFESSRYSFSLKDYILGWIANDMYIDPLADFISPFVETKEDVIKLRNACWHLYKKKFAFGNSADTYEKVKYGLNALFSSLDLKSNIFNCDDKDKEKKSNIIVPLKGRYQR